MGECLQIMPLVHISKENIASRAVVIVLKRLITLPANEKNKFSSRSHKSLRRRATCSPRAAQNRTRFVREKHLKSFLGSQIRCSKQFIKYNAAAVGLSQSICQFALIVYGYRHGLRIRQFCADSQQVWRQ